MGMKGKHSKGLKGHPKTWRQEVTHNWPLYVLVLPSIILAVIFFYIPMGGFVMAFQNYKPWLGDWGAEFIGIGEFKQIFMVKGIY